MRFRDGVMFGATLWIMFLVLEMWVFSFLFTAKMRLEKSEGRCSDLYPRGRVPRIAGRYDLYVVSFSGDIVVISSLSLSK